MKSVESIVNDMDYGEAIEFLIENEDNFLVSQEELNKIKAEAVRESIVECKYNGSDGQGWESDLEQYANKLEEGEL